MSVARADAAARAAAGRSDTRPDRDGVPRARARGPRGRGARGDPSRRLARGGSARGRRSGCASATARSSAAWRRAGSSASARRTRPASGRRTTWSASRAPAAQRGRRGAAPRAPTPAARRRARGRTGAAGCSRARRNIAYHYDLGNELFALFLDETMTYSCAVFERPDEPLEDAQRRKLPARSASTCELEPGDHLLEIGCGWGGFASSWRPGVRRRVTGLTISRAQAELARER